ncbi:MAG: hypothetical protein ACK41C_14285 [Phenylobacterium sp.]|jgi:hypothetical protein|uniref:hypothetical protein n=1 Tax=Phenylobacterium sp. TaxID=1871053 RepID=UPI00391C930B
MGDVIYLEQRRRRPPPPRPRRRGPAPAWMVGVLVGLISLPLIATGVAAVAGYG